MKYEDSHLNAHLNEFVNDIRKIGCFLVISCLKLSITITVLLVALKINEVVLSLIVVEMGG